MRSVTGFGALGIDFKTTSGRKRLFLVLVALAVAITMLTGPSASGTVLAPQGSSAGGNVLTPGGHGFDLMAKKKKHKKHKKKKKKKKKKTPAKTPPGTTPPGTTPPVGPGPAPSGPIKLSNWDLQLPTGTPGKPTTITAAALGSYSSQYFVHNSDGSISMMDPGTGCVTTPNSVHCRTELREASPATWKGTGTNTMSATLRVDKDNSPVIGQVHQDVSVKPLVELYYDFHGQGSIVTGVQQTVNATGQTFTTIAPDPPVGTTFSYVLSYSNNKLTLSWNGGAPKDITSGVVGQVGGYFKAGNYGQGAGPGTVTFSALTVTHG